MKYINRDEGIERHTETEKERERESFTSLGCIL